MATEFLSSSKYSYLNKYLYLSSAHPYCLATLTSITSLTTPAVHMDSVYDSNAHMYSTVHVYNIAHIYCTVHAHMKNIALTVVVCILVTKFSIENLFSTIIALND